MCVYVLTENQDGECLAVTDTFDKIKEKALEWIKEVGDSYDDDEIKKLQQWINSNPHELNYEKWYIELSGWYDSLIISKMEIE